MNELFERLTKVLLEKNKQLSYGQARTWVESLWEDFEATRAKAGHEYQGEKVTEKTVMKWIENYGPHLHNYASKNEKFKHLADDDHVKH